MGFASDLEEGKAFEDYCCLALQTLGCFTRTYASRAYQKSHGETGGLLEIKFDRKLASTGNLFVETECSGKPSGIYAPPCTLLWLHGDYDCAYLLARKDLLRMLPLSKPWSRKGFNASGFLVPASMVAGECIAVLRKGEWSNAATPCGLP